jgi:hypothetical protein
MADEFAQNVKGIIEAADAIVSTDKLLPIAVKNGTDWQPLEVDNTSGGLNVNVVNTSVPVSGTVTVTQATGTNLHAVIDSGAVTVSQATGSNLHTVIDSGSVTVSATDLDIRNLTPAQDEVKIGDGTNTLVVNGDGSINVVAASNSSNSAYVYGTVNLVKDTIGTVVTRTPPTVSEYYSGIQMSGAGQCEWEVKFGTTGSEATIMKFWTTPSHPTEYFDLPDYLTVATTQTLLVRATNREKSASPNSDFSGFATLVRKA